MVAFGVWMTGASPLGLNLLHGAAHEKCEGDAVVGLSHADCAQAASVASDRCNTASTIRDVKRNSNREIGVPLVVCAVALRTVGGVEHEGARLG
jgi:hypothetical protein